MVEAGIVIPSKCAFSCLNVLVNTSTFVHIKLSDSHPLHYCDTALVAPSEANLLRQYSPCAHLFHSKVLGEMGSAVRFLSTKPTLQCMPLYQFTRM